MYGYITYLVLYSNTVVLQWNSWIIEILKEIIHTVLVSYFNILSLLFIYRYADDL